MIRELISFLPSNNQEDPPFHPTNDDPLRRDKKLRELVPDNPNRPYDMKELIAAVVDESYFYEVQREFAPNILVGLARLGGTSGGNRRQSTCESGRMSRYQCFCQSGAIYSILRLFQYTVGDFRRRTRFPAGHIPGV
jgi:hypothetical protein